MAIAKSDITGIKMILRGTQPGVQLYTGQFLDGKGGKQGRDYGKQTAFCLETQHYPDSPNQPNFPSTELTPDAKYNQITYVYLTINESSA